MKRKRTNQRMLHVVNDKSGRRKLDLRFKLLAPEDLLSLTVTDDTTHSLKAYAIAYHVAMAQYTGCGYSDLAMRVLKASSLEVAKGR